MIKPQLYHTEAEIRAVLAGHLDELVSEGQEVKIGWNGGSPAVYTIRGYEPPEPKGKYADALFVHAGGDVVIITTPREITFFEVLPTRRMTPEAAYRAMREMENAAGLS